MIKKKIILVSSVLILSLGIAQPAFSDPNTNSDTDHSSEKTSTEKTSTNIEHEASVIKTEPIIFETRIVEDPQLPQGIEVIVSEGKNGEKTFYKDTESINNHGKIEQVPVRYDVINNLPQEKVVRQGTKTEIISAVSDKTIQLEKEKKTAENIAQKTADDKKKQEETKTDTVTNTKTDTATESSSNSTTVEAPLPAASEKTSKKSTNATQDTAASAPVENGRVTTPEENRAYAQSVLSPEEFTCADKLVIRESGWKTTAKNSSSGAYGVPQSLPGNKMASEGSDWQTNGKTQFNWMQKYVSQRYTTYCKALQHSYEKGWY